MAIVLTIKNTERGTDSGRFGLHSTARPSLLCKVSGLPSLVMTSAGTVATLGKVLHGTLDICLGLSLTAACILTGAYIRLKGSGPSAKKTN